MQADQLQTDKSPANNFPPFLIWLIGLSIVAACLTAIASMLGFIPGSNKTPLVSAASAPVASSAVVSSAVVSSAVVSSAVVSSAVASQTTPEVQTKPKSPSTGAINHHSSNRTSPPKPAVSVNQPTQVNPPTVNPPNQVVQAQPLAPPITQTPVVCRTCGYIESIHEISKPGQGSGIGAVGGAVVGGLLGNQIGKGGGRDLATIAGAVGGVFAGNEIEKHVKNSKEYEITIRMDDGSSRLIHETSPPAWRIGDSVKLIDGAIIRN